MIERNGVTIGSKLVAQPFVDDRYFQSRPSAAAYNPMSAAGSNQARTNPDLIKRLNDTVAEVARRENISPSAVPSDLVTQSGAGLDPHISPQAAAVQITRVAKARGFSSEQIDSLVARHTEDAQFGMLGQPRINVLELNLALDQATPVQETH